MLDIFEFKDGKLLLTTEALMHPVLKKIYDSDTTPNKGEAILKFTFLNYMVSYKKTNPFIGYHDLQERATKIVNSLYKGREDVNLDMLIEEYLSSVNMQTAYIVLMEMQNDASPSLKLYKAAIEGSNKLSNFLESVNLNQKTNSGSAVYKPMDVTNAIKESTGVVVSLQKLKDAVDSELSEANNTVRNRQVGYFERLENVV